MMGHATQIVFLSVVVLVFIALTGRRRLKSRHPGGGGMARLMKRLRGLGANVLGVVANGLKSAPEGHYEYYTYASERDVAPRRRLSRHKASR